MASKNVFEQGTRVSIFRFDPAMIKIDEKLNGRHDLPDIDWLVKDILERGQLQPVGVRKDGARPALVYGFSRWRAILKINREKLYQTPEPMTILATYFQGNERDGFIAAVRENRLRNSTTVLDDAFNIQRMFAWQMDEKQIALVYFPDANGDQRKAIAWVKGRAKLARLTPEAQEAVKEGRLKPTAAAVIAEMASEAQKDLASREKITASDIRKAQGKPERLSISGARTMILDAAVGRGISDGKTLPKWVQEFLEELAQKLK